MTNPTKYVIRYTDYYGEFFEAVKSDAKKSENGWFPKESKLSLKSGDKLKVEWPDKKTTTETIQLESGYDSTQVDMNNSPDHFETQKICVTRKYHGYAVLISLREGTVVYETKKRK